MYKFTITTQYANTVKRMARQYDSSVVVEEENANIIVLCFAQRPPVEWGDWLTSAMWNHRIKEYRVEYLGK